MNIINYGKIYELVKNGVKHEIKSSLAATAPEIKCEKMLSDLSKCFYKPNIKPQSVYEACKAKCVQSLKGYKPFEKTFILDAKTDSVLKELNGDLHSCYIDKRFISEKPVKILHGHTMLKDGSTPPVSFQDFKLLNDSSYITEISAVNKYGEESVLRKLPNYRHISNGEFNKMKKLYIESLLDGASRIERDKITELRRYCDSHGNCPAVEQEIAELLTELQYKKAGVEALDKFWKNYAGQIGLEYKPY